MKVSFALAFDVPNLEVQGGKIPFDPGNPADLIELPELVHDEGKDDVTGKQILQFIHTLAVKVYLNIIMFDILEG